MQEPILSEPKTPKEFPLYIKAFITIAKLLGYLLAVLILGGIFGEAMGMLIPDLNREDMLTGSLSDWKSMSLMYFGMTIAALLVSWFFRIGVDRLSSQTLGLAWKNVGVKLAKGAIWAIAIQSVVFITLYLSGGISATIADFNPIDLWGFLLLFLLIAIHEEVVFRGYITSLLAKDFHFIPTLIISSLIFAGVHIGNADFTWMGFWSIFLGGYLLGILFLKHQDLYLPIGLHWLWNYYQGNVLGFDVSGIDLPGFLKLDMSGADWFTGGEFGLEGSIIAVILLFIVASYLTYKWQDELILSFKNKNEPPTTPIA